MNDFIDKTISDHLETDEFYNAKATPLKSATLLKEENRQALKKTYEFTDLKNQFEKALSLIVNSELLSAQEKEYLKDHFFKPLSDANPHQLINRKNGKIIPQDIFQITPQAMEIIHQLGSKKVQEHKGEDAVAIFSLLSFLNPSILNYWVGLTSAYYESENYEKTLDFSQSLIEMSPSQSIGYIFQALTKRSLDSSASIQDEIAHVNAIFDADPDEKKTWEKLVKLF